MTRPHKTTSSATSRTVTVSHGKAATAQPGWLVGGVGIGGAVSMVVPVGCCREHTEDFIVISFYSSSRLIEGKKAYKLKFQRIEVLSQQKSLS
jgi:hypothetical protein